MRSALARRDALDSLALRADVNDALHEDAGQVDGLRIDRAGFDELLDFGDRDLAGHRAERIEVARRFVKDQVSRSIADRRADQREVADDAGLEHVLAAVEDTRLLLRRRDARRCRRRCGATASRRRPPACRRPPAYKRLECRSRRRVDARRAFLAARARPRVRRWRYCRSNSRFSPTYEPVVRRMRLLSSSTPKPQPSTPQLFETVTSSEAPCSSSASIRLCGMPLSPKPPTAIDAPLGMSATASAQEA